MQRGQHEVEIFADASYAVLRLEGAIDRRVLEQAFRALATHEPWRRGYDLVVDARRIRSLVLTSSDIDALVSECYRVRHFGSNRIAIVTVRDIDRKMAMLIQLKLTGSIQKEMLFGSVEVALQRLGRRPIAAHPSSTAVLRSES